MTNKTLPEPLYLRRVDAVEYLRAKYGFGGYQSLANAALKGNGPAFHRAGRGVVLYAPADLDAWAESRISRKVYSTAEADEVA